MARLHEYQGKALLAQRGVCIPRGGPASTPEQAALLTGELIDGGADGVVIKIQAWMTGRAAIGGVAFAATPEEASAHAARLLQMKVGAFPVTEVIVEEKIPIARELFMSLNIDDAARAPVLLLSFSGGSGIEERAGDVRRIPCDPLHGLDDALVREALASSGIETAHHDALAGVAHAVFRTARETEARSVEINPVAIAADGRVVAADCRMTIDDYAVFRHPELGIDIARELDHPPTRLERIAYAIEQADHRGTFYFAELPRDGGADERLIGFHGAGGGGSMMSMDAVAREGFTLANFCDTSGNPSVAKVYVAARIILSQPGIIGYFGSGSGVASQEQYHSAYGLAKAFWEMRLPIPAVIRLGGNSEDRAVQILESIAGKVRGAVEGYRKDDTPASCAERFTTLVNQSIAQGRRDAGASMRRHTPPFVGRPDAYSFPISGGRVWIDHPRCEAEVTELIVRHSGGLLREEGGRPVLAVSEEAAATHDSELIACEMECLRAGREVVFVDLPVPGLDEGGEA